MKKAFVFSLVLLATLLAADNAQAYDACGSCDPCCEDALFDGFYFGGNIGVLSNVARRNDKDGFLTDNSGWSTTETGVAGGVQAGYDWLCGCRVLGVVADWNKSSIDHNLRDDPNDATDINFVKSEFDWYSTIRARAGVQVCDALVYITGGAAVAKFDSRWRNNDLSFHQNKTRWGWTGGVGMEFLACGRVTVAGELFFMHFDEYDREFVDETASPIQTYRLGHNDSGWNGRIAVNYRFGNCCR